MCAVWEAGHVSSSPHSFNYDKGNDDAVKSGAYTIRTGGKHISRPVTMARLDKMCIRDRLLVTDMMNGQ